MSEGSVFEPLEREILSALAPEAPDPGAVFLLGAPRTGSTIVYQSCAVLFGLPFIANLTNDYFAPTPIVGLALQKAHPVPVGTSSRFGKTEGPFQPSEGSSVMTHWFGGGHPSQSVSASILPGRAQHFARTLAAAQRLFAKPLMIKNAWNCFRVSWLARALPRARFMWIRRDIAEAAGSDLEARYITKRSPHVWNSATPANYEELRRRPPVEQVVENQYEFNRAIGEALHADAGGRYTEIWYEDFVVDPHEVLTRAGAVLGLAAESPHEPLRAGEPVRTRALAADEASGVRDYIRAEGERLMPYRYASSRRIGASCSS
jgi:Sulfotransferase family